jgi:hypothetical protein
MGIVLGPDLGISPIILEYTSSATWVKPTSTKFFAAFIGCVGAGGGGGSGQTGASATLRRGGHGAGGGAIVYRWLLPSSIPSTVTITVGSGGNGGPAVSSSNTERQDGTNGGNTSFGSLVVAAGGGFGGTSNGGTVFSQCTPNTAPFANLGGRGGITNSTGVGFSTDRGLFEIENPNSDVRRGAPAGSAGGTYGSNNTAYNSENGGGIYDRGTLINGPTMNNSGTSNVAKYWFFDFNIPLTYGIGTGGAGGAVLTNGGNGGNYGGAGGGGGAATNGSTSGAGGRGGDGLCVVIELYGH